MGADTDTRAGAVSSPGYCLPRGGDAVGQAQAGGFPRPPCGSTHSMEQGYVGNTLLHPQMRVDLLTPPWLTSIPCAWSEVDPLWS